MNMPTASTWVDFEDFSFYRMDVVDVYYVGGFRVMGWVSACEYDRSQPDPLADSMAEIIQHMNADHKDALVLLAKKFADFGTLIWPHFGRLMWPHLIYSDRSSYP